MSNERNLHWFPIDSAIFSEAVVLKAAYWMSGAYIVEIRRDPASEHRILLGVGYPDRALTQDEVPKLELRLRRDLIDFRTREIVDAETRVVRELLVAKALAAVESLGRADES